MKIRQAVFLVTVLGLLFFVAGCSNNNASAEKRELVTYSREQTLPTDASFLTSGTGVTVGDIDIHGQARGTKYKIQMFAESKIQLHLT